MSLKYTFIRFIFIINFIIIITLYYCNDEDIHYLQIIVTACNRFSYLNRTLSSIFSYLSCNDKNIKYTIIYIDQGTPERYYIIQHYNIRNSFFINPKNYQYSFSILFSYVYLPYTFLLEEDWVIKDDILINPTFMENSIDILSLSNDIYGIILRNMVIVNESYCVLSVKNNKVKMVKLIHPFQNRNFLNGPTIYKTYILKKLKYYYSEYETGLFFLKYKYYMAFIYTSKEKHHGVLFKHIGINSTRLGLCNKYLY